MTVFGTRPEAIKFAPVIRAMSRTPELEVINIVTSQHTELLRPLIDLFEINVSADLDVMRHDQPLNGVLSRIIDRLDAELVRWVPDVVLVQGDTTSALAGALAAWNRQIAVGHIEAGLRSGNRNSPFPEEMNRRLVSQVASLHLAATSANRKNLLDDGIANHRIAVTGNPVVDALKLISTKAQIAPSTTDLMMRFGGRKPIVMTSHRRENFGDKMLGYFDVLKQFVSQSDQYVLVFPVHPNPAVRNVAEEAFGSARNVELIDPLKYSDFIHLLSRAWLVVSDSGGIQEEAPSLQKALLVLRENTERPEGVEAGVARLVQSPADLLRELNEASRPGSWIEGVKASSNPFGDGNASRRIAGHLTSFLKDMHQPDAEIVQNQNDKRKMTFETPKHPPV
ncbi:MAG: non-hydrolyzing UDP-N-acetylglucosamine 2-epimerase [Ruegeria sp.]